jgi:uncharacterized protein
MIIDCHVHLCADTPEHGVTSPRVRKSLGFRFMRWRLGVGWEDGAAVERNLAHMLVKVVAGTPEIDAAVVLAFDAVYTRDGVLDRANTHLYDTNDYALEVVKSHPKLLFGASVHPYRRDAVAEVERCVAAGAVLMKWLPITQNMNPADERCLPFYDALAHHKLPLLCHTGGEKALPNLDLSLADPDLLVPALKRGVTVVMAHCGTRSAPGETDYLPTFTRLVKEYEHCYGDTSALNLPMRSYAYRTIFADEAVRRKVIHGSDWPIIAIPPLRLGLGGGLAMWREGNWMRRDVLIKQRLGFDDAYWHRGSQVLRLPSQTDQSSR